jgi:hypothetical protein
MTPMIDEEIVYRQSTQKHAPLNKNRKHAYKILTLFLIFSNLLFLGFFTYNEFFLVKKPTTNNFPEKIINETDNLKFSLENVLILQNRILENLVNYNINATDQLKFISENIFNKIVGESGQSLELQNKILGESGQSLELQNKILGELQSPLMYEKILNNTNLNLIKIINSQFGETFKINIITDLSSRVQSAYASILLPQLLNTISTEMFQIKANQEYVLKQYFNTILKQNEVFLNNLIMKTSNSSNASNFLFPTNDSVSISFPNLSNDSVSISTNNITEDDY